MKSGSIPAQVLLNELGIFVAHHFDTNLRGYSH